MITIKEIHGREILDSRGNPTIEADITLADGSKARACKKCGEVIDLIKEAKD